MLYSCFYLHSQAYRHNQYPVYHSVHDNFYWITKFGDPSFAYSVAVGEVWAKVAMAIATSPIIPYNPVRYYERLLELYNLLEADYGSVMKQNNITTSNELLILIIIMFLSVALLWDSLNDFKEAATNLQATLVAYQDTDK